MYLWSRPHPVDLSILCLHLCLFWHRPRAVGLEASLPVIGVPSAHPVPSPFPSSLPPLLHGKVFTAHILPCGWAFASRLMLVPLILCVFLAASRSWPLTAFLRRACTCPQVTESSERSRRWAGLAAWLSTAQPQALQRCVQPEASSSWAGRAGS